MIKYKKTLTTVLTFSVALSVVGCNFNEVEGTGHQEGSSSEQLALRLRSSWRDTQNKNHDALDGEYVDGNYSGRGQGMEGWIDIEIEVKDNKVSVVSLRQEGETQSVGGYEGIRDGVYSHQIDDAQGTDIDGISGATITTNGVLQALEAALAEARVEGEKVELNLADLKDGEYEGEGKGIHGSVRVKIAIDKGVLKVISITHDDETEGFGGKEAIEDGSYADQIEKAQSADIDGVSGATITSKGVIDALNKALKQAK